jgi:phage gp29-like protein
MNLRGLVSSIFSGRQVAASDYSPSDGGSIIVPLARERLQDIFEREQGPQRVKRTLESAFSGDLHHFQLLIDAMMDSWPLLQKNIAEIGRRASTELWETHPYAPRNQKATPEAEKLADEVYDAVITGMRPTPGTSEQDFEGMIVEMTRGYFSGHYVGQILWEVTAESVRPRAVQEIRPPRYAYAWDGVDRLLVDLSETGTQQYQDFPQDSFLIAINKGHSAHASVAAPLRALMGYWLAAVYGLKWFSGFCELFGIPWRHAKSDDVNDHGKLAQALALFGSRGYAVTKTGATLDLVEAASTGTSLPQKELIDLADRQCNLFILGQTLTSGTDSSGSRALGDVHERTLENVVQGVADWIGKALTRQLVPAYIRLNYGEEREDAPEIWPKREAVKDEKAMAERDNLLGITDGSTPVEAAWFYERHGIPMPKEGDQLYQPAQTDPGKSTLQRVAAAAANEEVPTIERLLENVRKSMPGASREWLAPVRPFFEKLIKLAEDDSVTEVDFQQALKDAQKKLPELFERFDTEKLERALRQGMGAAVIAGSTKRYES